MNKYKVSGIAGEGQYGTVYRAELKGTKDQVAIKKFKLGEDECTQREIDLLQRLKHPNIVAMKEIFREAGKLHMVFEYCPQDMLAVLGRYPNGMSEKLVKRYVKQMCRALKYVHTKHVIHRDVKPENLLVMGNPEADDPNENSMKLCDFGVARTVGLQDTAQLTGYVSTRWYRAPELVMGNAQQVTKRGGMRRVVRSKQKKYSHPVDVWAVGCVMFELITAKPLFPGKSDVDQLDLIRRYGGIGPGASASGGEKVLRMRCGGKLSEEGFDLMKRMLQMDMDERITCEQALRHPYFYDPNKPAPRAVDLNGVAQEVADSGDESMGEESEPETVADSGAGGNYSEDDFEEEEVVVVRNREKEERRRRKEKKNKRKKKRDNRGADSELPTMDPKYKLAPLENKSMKKSEPLIKYKLVSDIEKEKRKDRKYKKRSKLPSMKVSPKHVRVRLDGAESSKKSPKQRRQRDRGLHQSQASIASHRSGQYTDRSDRKQRRRNRNEQRRRDGGQGQGQRERRRKDKYSLSPRGAKGGMALPPINSRKSKLGNRGQDMPNRHHLPAIR